MPTIAALIRHYRQRAEMTQEELGRRVGVTKNAVTQWEKEGGTVPKTLRLAKIEQALSIERGTLTSKQEADTPNRDVEVSLASAGVYRVPVISYVAASGWQEVVDPYELGGGSDVLQTDEPVSSSAFALIVEGDSMMPEFRPGDRIVIDPSATPQPGEFVVAKLNNRDEATFKKYRPRGFDDNGVEIVELMPLNPDWPTLYIDADHPGYIIGPVVEHRRSMRR